MTLTVNDWEVSFGVKYAIKKTVLLDYADRLGLDINKTFLRKIHLYENETLRIWGERKKDKNNGSCNGEKTEECKALYGKYFEEACETCKGDKKT